MLINKIEFAELEKDLSETRKSFKDFLAPETGKVYVIAITRDGCPACARQRPKITELAKTMTKMHGRTVVFSQVHVKRPEGSDEESFRSKEVLGHYFYPSNLILLRTRDKGVVEYYKNVSPRMSELKRNIETAVKIAAILKK